MKHLKLKDCIILNCVSFTTVNVILSLLAFNPELMETVTHVYTLKLFLCTSIISFLMYFSSKLNIESQTLEIIVEFSEVAAVILGIGGGILKLFPWELNIVLEVVVVLIAVYFITYSIMVWHSTLVANKINKKLQERENESNNRG